MSASVCLGEICEFAGGGTPSRKISEYWNGDIPWATVKDFSSDRISKTLEHVSHAGVMNSATRVVPAGTILLVTRVGLGKVAIAEVDLAINQDVKALYPSSAVIQEYLLWALKYVRPRLLSKGVGATVKGVTLRDVKDLEIPLPPLDEQQRIVGILNRAAKIERLRTRAQELMREFIPALFIKMFGDPAENPMGWNMRSLGELCDMDRRGIGPDDPTASRLPFVGVENIESDSGIIDFDNGSRIGSQRSTTFRFDQRHVLYGKLRPYLNKVATPAFTGRCSTELVPLLPRSGVDRDFIACLLRRTETVEYVMASVTGSRMPRTDMKALMLLPAPLPPLAEQRRFAEIVETTRTVVSHADSSRKNASGLSASLMSRLLRDAA